MPLGFMVLCTITFTRNVLYRKATEQQFSMETRLRAAASGMLLECTAEAFGVWDGGFCASMALEHRDKALIGPRDEAKDVDAWDKDNEYLFNKLLIAIKMCTAAIIATIPHKAQKNGRGAYQSVKEKCLGTGTGDTMVALLIQLFTIIAGDDIDMDSIVTNHSRLTTRIMGFRETQENPLLFLDRLFKMHLLQLVQRNSRYSVVEESCSPQDITYADAIEKINAKTQRLKATLHSAEGSHNLTVGLDSSATSAAMFSRAASDVCLFCGQKGHWAAECPKRKQTGSDTEEGDSPPCKNHKQKKMDRFRLKKAQARVEDANAALQMLQLEVGAADTQEIAGAAEADSFHLEDSFLTATQAPSAEENPFDWASGLNGFTEDFGFGF